jgi:hypothetical protein
VTIPTPRSQHLTEPNPGLVYARTAQGDELPVIDVTNPAFRVADDLTAVEAMRNEFAAGERRRKQLPKFLLRYFMRSAARRSPLARALFQPEGGVLPGLSTYLMKLGPDNLRAPFGGKIDRQFAASPGALSMRMRLQQVAKLLVRGLEGELQRHPKSALHFINIGGGTAMDSLNALILLRSAAPQLVEREITVHVLDPDTNGPSFGATALAALGVNGAPLAGMDVRFVHSTYDWRAPEQLGDLVRGLAAEDAVVAASSEGALFEYGDDEAVVANLRSLYAEGGGVRVVAGSVTRADEMTRQSIALTPFRLVPRGAEAFAALIKATGYSITRVEPALLSDQVLLMPATSAAGAR